MQVCLTGVKCSNQTLKPIYELVTYLFCADSDNLDESKYAGKCLLECLLVRKLFLAPLFPCWIRYCLALFDRCQITMLLIKRKVFYFFGNDQKPPEDTNISKFGLFESAECTVYHHGSYICENGYYQELVVNICWLCILVNEIEFSFYMCTGVYFSYLLRWHSCGDKTGNGTQNNGSD